MADDEPKSLEERTQRAMLQYALMRPEQALLLAFATLFPTIMSAGGWQVGPIPNFVWLIGGLVAYGALAWSSYTDPKMGARVVKELLEDDYDPGKIKNEQLQAKVTEALDYRARLTELIEERGDSALKVQLESMLSQFDDWIEEIYDLALRLEDYESEKARLVKSYVSAEKRLKELQQRRKRVHDEKVREDIDNNIASRERQMDTIKSLDNTMERAKLRLENTVTAMSTIYSQTLLLSAKDIDSDRYSRLQQEIADEVDELSDILYAMDEVYNESDL